MAATPKFVISGDWTAAVPAEVFRQFARQLAEDPDRTLSRFLALQVRGAEGGGETLRRLRSALRGRRGADRAALCAGLGFLQDADMRRSMRASGLPVYWLLGERDTLIPVGVKDGFAELPSALIAGAGHAPFLSHPVECSRQLCQWLLPDAEQARNAAR
jgi:pimeloyl-[acyl-carrier protein] methyl ester esterase